MYMYVRRLHLQNRTLWSQMHIRTYVHMCICDIGLAQGQAGRPPPDQKIQDREEMEARSLSSFKNYRKIYLSIDN